MISDAQNQLSKAQALSGAGAINSTNVIDLTQTTRDVGIGEPLAICFTVDVALGGTSPTFSAAAVVSAAAGLTSPTTLVSSATYSGAAAFPAGFRFYLLIPPGYTPLEFLGVIYTLGGTSPTATVTANVIPARFAQADAYGASGFTVQ
jgi:hypothetical protein